MLRDSDFPDLQDLDSLHLEDYQMIQENLRGKHEHLRNNLYHDHILNKPDLLIQDTIENQIDDGLFTFDLLNGCPSDLNFIPHLETLESVFGSLHEDEIEFQEPHLFIQRFNDDFLQHAIDSDLNPSTSVSKPSTSVSIPIPNGSTIDFSRSNSTSPLVTLKNQKRLNSFDSDDIFQVKQDEPGKKKKWSDVELSSNLKADVKVAKAPADKAVSKRAPKKSSDGEMRAPKKSSDGEMSSTGDKLPRHKRPSHINAEQRRRSKIQNCLDQLHEVVPVVVTEASGPQNGSSKKSKASILYKTANCCRLLKSKTRDLESETDALRAEIKSLCKQIKEYQSKLPENGATSSPPSSSSSSSSTAVVCSSSRTVTHISMSQRFEDYAHISTLRNWKFWMFSLFIRPIFNAYWNSVGHSANINDFKRHVLLWLRDECKLSILRGTITNALLTVSSRTSAVNNASNLPVESIRESMRDAGIDLFTSSSRPDSR